MALWAQRTRVGRCSEQALAAAALLGGAPIPPEAIDAALRDSHGVEERAGRRALSSLAQRSLLRRTAQGQWQFTHVLGYRFARRETGSDAAVRMRLAEWLYEQLANALTVGAGNGGLLSIAHALEHLGALLRADDDQSLWEPLASAALYRFADPLHDLGRLGQMKITLGAVAEWLDRLPRSRGSEPRWLRERSVLINRRGDVLWEQGDLAGALAVYQDSLQLSRRLAGADPSNAGWQRDLSYSLTVMAQLCEQQGDRTEALRFAQEKPEDRRASSGT